MRIALLEGPGIHLHWKHAKRVPLHVHQDPAAGHAVVAGSSYTVR
jgi:hypothetical protein